MPSDTRSAPTGDLPQILRAVDRALRSGDVPLAGRLAQQALAGGLVHPLLFEARGRCRKQRGLLKDALDDLQRAHTLAPKSAAILCELAECLNGLGRHKMAILACGDALAIDEALPAAWFHKAIAHQLLNQPERACDCYLQTVRLKPDAAGAYARLANLSALQGRHAETRDFAERALALVPDDAVAVMALARADLAEDQFEDAERHLTWLVGNAEPDLKAIALGCLGDLRDAQGKTREAFEAYRDAGATFRAAHAARAGQFGSETGCEQVRRVTRAFETLPPQSWSASAR
ncbi:MAG TPA: tetratricopeptide repeat protein [Rhizomicrobium sp.]|nr:tetratricopeptide repeat protein [Rhizomicrobium sp.]